MYNINFVSVVLCEQCFWNLRICVHICAFMQLFTVNVDKVLYMMP